MLVDLKKDLNSSEAIHKYAILMKSVKTDKKAKEILIGLRSKFYDIFHERIKKLNQQDTFVTPESLNIQFNIYVSDCHHYLKGTTGEEKNGPLLIINIIGDKMNYVWDDIDIKGTTDYPPQYVEAVGDMARYQ